MLTVELKTKTQLHMSSSLIALSIALLVFTSSDALSTFDDIMRKPNIPEVVRKAQTEQAKRGAFSTQVGEAGQAAREIQANAPATWNVDDQVIVARALVNAKVEVSPLTTQQLEATQALNVAGIPLTLETIQTTAALIAAGKSNTDAATWVKGVQGMNFADADQVTALTAIAAAGWVTPPNADDIKAYAAMTASATAGTNIAATPGNPSENECRAYVAASKAGGAPATQAELAAFMAYHGITGTFAATADELTQVNNLVAWGAGITANTIADYGVMVKAKVTLDQPTWDVVAQARAQLGAGPTEADLNAALEVVNLAAKATPAITTLNLNAAQINATKALQAGGVAFTSQDQVKAAAAIHGAQNAIRMNDLTLDQLNLYDAAAAATAGVGTPTQAQIADAILAFQRAATPINDASVAEITCYTDILNHGGVGNAGVTTGGAWGAYNAAAAGGTITASGNTLNEAAAFITDLVTHKAHRFK